tara:strand:- start:861 stop:1079 length:219 start_codon:yes stop_codon:yes gene_type:complete
MTTLKLIPLLITISLLFACGSENSTSKNDTSEQTPHVIFESQKKVLDEAKDVESMLADEEQKRKDKMKKLGL